MPAPLAHSQPSEIGLDGDRLQWAYARLTEWTSGEDAPVPGGAILVGRHGKIVEPRFVSATLRRRGLAGNATSAAEPGFTFGEPFGISLFGGMRNRTTSDDRA